MEYQRSRLCSLDSLENYFEDSVRGYEECFLSDYSLLVDNTTLQCSTINNGVETSTHTREFSTQTDLHVTYPDLYHQILRQINSLNDQPTSLRTHVSYVNINQNESQQENPQIGFENPRTETSAPPSTGNSRTSGKNARENLRNRFLRARTPLSAPGGQEVEGGLENRVSRWIDQETAELHRLSNSTVYEDIEDVVSYFRDQTTPPPLPPRLARTVSEANILRRKNLTEHLGVDFSSADLGSAQRIALENYRSSSASQSRKDLNKFLGMSESPVKRRRRVPAATNRNSFIESLIHGKLFKGRGRDEREPDEPAIRPDELRQKCLDDYYDEDEYDKSRSSSFSSTNSSSALSSASSVSMRSAGSVSKLLQSAKPSDLLGSLRRNTKRRYSIQSVFDAPSLPAETTTAAENVSQFAGLPIIPFSRPSPLPADRQPADIESVGHSLDAVITAAKLELSRHKSPGLVNGSKMIDESIYMAMSTEPSNSDLYMDMNILRQSLLNL